MASNKNQHFVPRCYLRAFSIDSGNTAINLYNIDRKKFIKGAAVKHQCSKDYFYGEDLQLEKALQFTEGTYATILVKILTSAYTLTNNHRNFLRYFWLLQHLRTESASRKAVEMSEGMGKIIGDDAYKYRLGIRGRSTCYAYIC